MTLFRASYKIHNKNNKDTTNSVYGGCGGGGGGGWHGLTYDVYMDSV